MKTEPAVHCPSAGTPRVQVGPFTHCTTFAATRLQVKAKFRAKPPLIGIAPSSYGRPRRRAAGSLGCANAEALHQFAYAVIEARARCRLAERSITIQVVLSARR